MEMGCDGLNNGWDSGRDESESDAGDDGVSEVESFARLVGPSATVSCSSTGGFWVNGRW